MSKAALLDAMVAIMPLLKPLSYVGISAFVVGEIALLLWQGVGLRNRIVWVIAWLAGWLLSMLAALLLAFQVMGLALGANASINVGDAAKFEFVMVPLWQVALGMAFAGLWLHFQLIPTRPRSTEG